MKTLIDACLTQRKANKFTGSSLFDEQNFVQLCHAPNGDRDTSGRGIRGSRDGRLAAPDRRTGAEVLAACGVAGCGPLLGLRLRQQRDGLDSLELPNDADR